MIFYVICETIVIKVIRRNNTPPKSETDAINDVIVNVEENLTEEEQNGTT